MCIIRVRRSARLMTVGRVVHLSVINMVRMSIIGVRRMVSVTILLGFDVLWCGRYNIQE
jgi:hypothetical protein